MDFNQRDYFNYIQSQYQMPQTAVPMYPMPLPPMTMLYPYTEQYMSEAETDRDMEYMRQMYSNEAKKVQKKVEEECDRLEYEGSMMYDEYPDRVTLMLLCDRIMNELSNELSFEEKVEESMNESMGDTDAKNNVWDMQATDCHGRRSCRRDSRPPRSLVEVLLYNEMHKRRCKQRKCRRFW